MANEANEFFVSREGASHQGNECIHFKTHVNRTLSIAEATRLRDKLTELLGDAPAPLPSAADLDADAEEKEVAEAIAPPKKWGKK